MMLIKQGILLAALAWAGTARGPFSPADLWLWRQAELPAIDSGAAHVVYVERWTDREHDRVCANLWMISADGRDRRAITEGAWSDTDPHWSPDGTRVAYISDRDGGSRIRIYTLSTGHDAAVSGAGYEPVAVAWSPDGKTLAFTGRTAGRVQAPWAPPEVLQRLVAGPGAMQVFLVAADGGDPRQLSTGAMTVRGEPAWMPQGDWILNAAGSSAEATEIYGLHVSDGEVRQLTHHAGPDDHPLPSPDGSKIAWVAAEPRPAAYAVRHLWVMGRDGQHVKMLTGELDRDVVSPQWSSDSRTVYFLADDRGSTHVYAARADGTVRQVTDRQERLSGFSLADNGQAATVRSTPNEAEEVVRFAVDLPGGVTTLAAPNQKLLAERNIARGETIRYQSAGQTLEGRLLKPPQFDAGRKYPLLLDIHDDPRAMCGAAFSLREQIFAARGFVVLCANPRGTPGYGEVFGNLLPTAFPGDDFDDLMRGVDFVTANAYIDRKRLVATGGLLAAWALGHTDRFAAVVARRPIVDWVADIALAADPHRRAGWMGGMPWDDPDQYVKHSPIYFARSFRTPTLVIAGEHDPQSRELYFALREHQVDAALMRTEGAGPAEQTADLEAELAWFSRTATTHE
jgi:dipeptidyl aminopeptidase/acylaminoacyl peptidase